MRAVFDLFSSPLVMRIPIRAIIAHRGYTCFSVHMTLMLLWLSAKYTAQSAPNMSTVLSSGDMLVSTTIDHVTNAKAIGYKDAYSLSTTKMCISTQPNINGPMSSRASSRCSLSNLDSRESRVASYTCLYTWIAQTPVSA